MSYSSTVLADTPVGYWRLGEASSASAAVDQTGNASGTYTNIAGIAVGQPGISGGAGDTAVGFTAASHGFVAITDAAAQHVGDVFSIEGWVKLTAAVTTRTLFASDTGSGPSVRLNTSNQIILVCQSVAGVVTSTVAISDTTSLHHIVVTKNAATSSKIYLDGVDVSGAVTNHTMSGTGTWRIGTDGANGGNNYMDGVIDEVALYSTPLSATQVSAHYAAGIAGASLGFNPAVLGGVFF